MWKHQQAEESKDRSTLHVTDCPKKNQATEMQDCEMGKTG